MRGLAASLGAKSTRKINRFSPHRQQMIGNEVKNLIYNSTHNYETLREELNKKTCKTYTLKTTEHRLKRSGLEKRRDTR